MTDTELRALAEMKLVEGAGFRLLTSDPIMIAVVRRCGELERELRAVRHEEVARYRTLRRDVTAIKRAVRGARA